MTDIKCSSQELLLRCIQTTVRSASVERGVHVYTTVYINYTLGLWGKQASALWFQLQTLTCNMAHVTRVLYSGSGLWYSHSGLSKQGCRSDLSLWPFVWQVLSYIFPSLLFWGEKYISQLAGCPVANKRGTSGVCPSVWLLQRQQSQLPAFRITKINWWNVEHVFRTSCCTLAGVEWRGVERNGAN